MLPVKHHHILVDGVPLCRLPANDGWARFFTCYYQWEATAKQAAAKIAAMECNRGRRVEIVPGKCACGR